MHHHADMQGCPQVQVTVSDLHKSPMGRLTQTQIMDLIFSVPNLHGSKSHESKSQVTHFKNGIQHLVMEYIFCESVFSFFPVNIGLLFLFFSIRYECKL
jgi:hypothetical protein